jgi:hypothetical protein
LLGRLEYQRGNFDAALQVLQGIDITSLKPRMTTAITESAKPRVSPRSSRRKTSQVNGMLVHMSMHSVSLLLEAILLKAKSLESLDRVTGTEWIFSLYYLLPFTLVSWLEIATMALEVLRKKKNLIMHAFF